MMRNDLLNVLKPSPEIDWDNAKWKSAALATWTVVKWLLIGFLTISLWGIWLIVSIAFSEVTERGGQS